MCATARLRSSTGHDTHPIDIERALNGEYSKDTRKRDLQLEAKAHVAVQRW